MKPLLPFFVILLFPLALLADEPLWKNFVKEETFLIAHVDLNKIEPATVIQNNQSLVETVLRAMHSEMNLQAVSALGSAGKKYLTETLGIQEAYLVCNIQVPSLFTVILPQSSKIDLQNIISQLIPMESKPWLEITPSADNKYVLIFPRMGREEFTDSERAEHIAQHLPSVPADRPAFAEAFANVENAPIKIAAAIPDFAKKVIKETAPKLQPPFDSLDIITSLTELRWKAVGIDPAKTAINVTATMTTNAAAEAVKTNWQQAVPVILDMSPDLFSGGHAYWEIAWKHYLRMMKENQIILQTLQLMQREGATLALRLEKPQFEKILDSMLPMFSELAAERAIRLERKKCADKIKSLLLAFHNYHESQNVLQLPTPYTVGKTGKPLHSWRVLILPYLHEPALYKQIRLDEPWDSEHNKQFHDKMPSVFRCPNCTQGNPQRDTTYCLVVGDETMNPPGGKPLTFPDFTDGTSNTIVIAERKTPVCWMEPVDILQEDAYLGVNKTASGIGSEHSGGVAVGFLDGSSRFLLESVDLKMLKALLTKAGGEWFDEKGVIERIE